MIQSSVRGKLAPMKKGPVNPSSIGTPGYSNEILIDSESRKAKTKLRDTCSGNPAVTHIWKPREEKVRSQRRIFA